MPLAPGTRLGPYAIQSPVGAGGMGEVYQALDTRLQRRVAIKILSRHLSEDPALRERFDREARTISSLSDPHICALFDVGHQDGVDFLVLEFLEGETRCDRLGRLSEHRLPLADVLAVAIDIASALEAAHQAGVVHRDLKPGNVMLTRSGAKLLDFGLAKQAAVAAAGRLTASPTASPPLTAARSSRFHRRCSKISPVRAWRKSLRTAGRTPATCSGRCVGSRRPDRSSRFRQRPLRAGAARPSCERF